MIYASLKPVHQWHNAHVVPVYLALALMSGALWLNALLLLWNRPSVVVAGLAALVPGPTATLAALLALAAATAGLLVERWLFFAEAKHTVSLYYGALEA
jgi:DMSO reductase anchor subunit